MPVSYADAIAAIEAHLGGAAVAHSRRVGDAAAALAVAYGVDPERARLAGVLHDWDRERTTDELLRSADAAGFALTDAERTRPRLLHARTGAVAAQDALPGLPDEVADAIARHTVGSSEMTRLDMVVYLADMIEPKREYPGVNELRDAASAVSLDELFALGYQQSVLHLVNARKLIHPDTVAVWNRFVAGATR